MGELQWSRASFRNSLVPMVLADDTRRYVAANAAACLLLRLPEEEVLALRIEDMTPAESRSALEALWAEFISEEVQEGTFDLQMPDASRLRVDYSATANVEPGIHLSVLMFPPAEPEPEAEPETKPEAEREPAGAGSRPSGLLTNREREVLGMVAMGRATAWIAAELGVSASTIETHIRHCLDKLGARNRAHAIALGIRAGEIRLELEPAHH